jgi:hypothetical protein
VEDENRIPVILSFFKKIKNNKIWENSVETQLRCARNRKFSKIKKLAELANYQPV